MAPAGAARAGVYGGVGVAIPASVVDNFEAVDADPPGVYESGQDLYTYWTTLNGKTSDAYRTTGRVKEGGHSLYVNAESTSDSNSVQIESVEGDGLNYYPQRGDVFSFWYYMNITSSDGDGPRHRTYWGDADGLYNIRHWYGRDREIELNGPGVTATGILPSENMWTLYVIDFDSAGDGNIVLTYYDNNLSQIDQLTISDNSYGGGRIRIDNNHDTTNPLSGEMWYDEIKTGDQGAGYL